MFIFQWKSRCSDAACSALEWWTSSGDFQTKLKLQQRAHTHPETQFSFPVASTNVGRSSIVRRHLSARIIKFVANICTVTLCGGPCCSASTPRLCVDEKHVSENLEEQFYTARNLYAVHVGYFWNFFSSTLMTYSERSQRLHTARYNRVTQRARQGLKFAGNFSESSSFLYLMYVTRPSWLEGSRRLFEER